MSDSGEHAVTILLRAAAGAQGPMAVAAAESGIVGLDSPERLRPLQIRLLDDLGAAPALFAAIVAALALVILGVGVLGEVRGRDEDLAVLRVMGMRRQDLHQMAAWEVGVITLPALAVGLALGLVGGRAVWSAVADELGVAGPAVAPLNWLTATAVGVLAGAQVLGAAGLRPLARAPLAALTRRG